MLNYRIVRRHLRRMRRRKYRRRRRALAGFFAVVFLYLAAIGGLREEFFHIAEEQTFQVTFPQEPDGSRTTFRILFRIRSGELIIYREETEIVKSRNRKEQKP